MIIGSGIFLIYRENIKKREIVSSVPMRSAVTNTTNVDEEDYIGEREYKPMPLCF